MAFRLHCDRCLRFLQVVDANKVRDLAVSGKETICKQCEAAEITMTKVADSLKAKVNNAANELMIEFKANLTEELKKIVEENRKVM